jgi:Transposase DDE domain
VNKREQQRREKGVKYDPAELRTSTTDAEASRMKMPDGGTRPAYNVQFATTVEGGAIVGVDVVSSGGDGGQMQPMLEQLERRYQEKPREMLVDGGFTTLADIEQAAAAGVKVLGPLKNEESKKAKGKTRTRPKRAMVRAWGRGGSGWGRLRRRRRTSCERRGRSGRTRERVSVACTRRGFAADKKCWRWRCCKRWYTICVGRWHCGRSKRRRNESTGRARGGETASTEPATTVAGVSAANHRRRKRRTIGSAMIVLCFRRATGC